MYGPVITSPSSSILGPAGENVRKSIKTCALSSSTNGSDDVCALGMAHVKIYLTALLSLEDTNFERVPFFISFSFYLQLFTQG